MVDLNHEDTDHCVMHKVVFVVEIRETSGIRFVQSLIDRVIVVDLNHEDTDHCVIH